MRERIDMARIERLFSVQPAPPWMRQLVSVVMTISAALLYAVVLWVAIYRTFSEGDPVFSLMMSRAAGVLGGLVGAVVAAGFSHSGRGISIHVAGPRRHLVRHPIHWVKCNFFGLAKALGLPLLPEIVFFTDHPGAIPPDAERPGEDDPMQPAPLEPPLDEPEPDGRWFEIDEPTLNKVSLGISVLYFAIYFLTGFGAFGLAVARANVPDLISNAAWVWLGSLVSSGYSFFALNADGHIVS